MYTITLSDGRKLENLAVNGTNFVSKTKVDEKIFQNNLAAVVISDGKTERAYENLVFIQQMEWADGTYYLAFREKTRMELLAEEITENSTDMADVQDALVELAGLVAENMTRLDEQEAALVDVAAVAAGKE